MKMLLFSILLFISSLVIAQDTVGLKKAAIFLNEALLKKDTVRLRVLLHEDISYGHSNGWLQSKKEVIGDFASGKIEYTLIEQIGAEKYTIHNNAVAVNSITKVAGKVNSNAFNMNLQVLQVWKRIKKQWVLIARQSVKI